MAWLLPARCRPALKTNSFQGHVSEGKNAAPELGSCLGAAWLKSFKVATATRYRDHHHYVRTNN